MSRTQVRSRSKGAAPRAPQDPSEFAAKLRILRIAVLRAALRCARHRREVTREALLVRVDCSETELTTALQELSADGLVRSPEDARLTMTGLAIAVATIRPVAAATVVQRARSAA